MKIIDLSMPIYEGMPRFWGNWHSDVKIETTGTYDKNQCLVQKIVMSTHSGTHIDAPRHFFLEGKSIDKINLKQLITKALVLNLTSVKENQKIEQNMMENFNLNNEESLIINTGWYKRWDTGNYYKDFPEFTVDSALYILKFRNIAAIATDIPFSVDVHRIFLGSGIILIENIVNLDSITTETVDLIALPLRIVDGDAAPARVIAIER